MGIVMTIVLVAMLGAPAPGNSGEPAPGKPDLLEPATGVMVPPPGYSAPPKMDKDQIITNYWKHVKTILSTEAARPKPKRNPSVRYPPPRSFPFDALKHLRAQDLIRAAKEGIHAARAELEGRPEAEVERQVEANIHLCLEYYPILVEDEEDLNSLMYLMEDAHADRVMRRFLLARCAPGLVPSSLFASYLQENLIRRRYEHKRILSKITSGPYDYPDVQLVAMDAFYAVFYTDYVSTLERDKAIADFAQRMGKAVAPNLLLEPECPDLLPETSLMLKRLNEGLMSFVRGLATHFKPGSHRSVAFQQKARALIVKIRDQFPLPEREAVQAILDAHPEASLRAS